jgi:formylglycine-generating enzyme required for sulfatase activity
MQTLRGRSRTDICRHGILAVSLAMGLMLSACDNGEAPVRVSADGEGSEASFTIALSKAAQISLARAEVVITAADMLTMQQELQVSAEAITGGVEGIPAGPERLFTLNGYDAAGALIYTGSSRVDLVAGTTASVRITMRPVGAATGQPGGITVKLLGGAMMEFVWIEPGTFLMGAPETEAGFSAGEGPQHEVTLTEGFYLGKYEVTQAQWESVMETRPGGGADGGQRPASSFSWASSQQFIHRLNHAAEDSLYRLPTEAEWEYACRAGTTTSWSFGNDESQLGDYAWFTGNNTPSGTKDVGSKHPNPWGLYGMHGNVSEWCQDWSASYWDVAMIDPSGPPTGSYRVVRGGSYGSQTRYTRSAYRGASTPGSSGSDIGARLVRIR